MTPGQGHFCSQGHNLNKLGKGLLDDEPCFSTNQNNLNNFGGGSSKDHLYQVHPRTICTRFTQGPFVPGYFEICPVVFDKKIFIFFFNLVAVATRILHGMEFFEQL